MSDKHYAEVLIDGKIYTLGGSEEEHYLQKVASYINEKMSLLRKQPGFTKQSQDYQSVMIQLNIADDYFKAMEEARQAKRQRDEMEKESYSLKHELVTTQMKLEAALREAEEYKNNLQSPQDSEYARELKELKEENQKLRAVQAAASHAGRNHHN